MKKMKNPLGFVLLVLLIGCKTVTVNNKMQYTTNGKLEPGVIGHQYSDLINSDFTITAIPELNEKIKLEVSKIPFNKNKFAAYLKASGTKEMNLQYVDSIPEKPVFMEIRLIDKVSLINQVNNDEEVMRYLKEQDRIEVVTSVSMVLDNMKMTQLEEAENVFLVNDSYKNYRLEVVDKKGTAKQISFNDGVVFAYGLSTFCWGENEKHRVVIEDIVDDGKGCPADTYRKAKLAKKEMDIYKY